MEKGLILLLRHTEHIYPWSDVTQIFRDFSPSYGGDRNSFDVMTSIESL